MEPYFVTSSTSSSTRRPSRVSCQRNPRSERPACFLFRVARSSLISRASCRISLNSSSFKASSSATRARISSRIRPIPGMLHASNRCCDPFSTSTGPSSLHRGRARPTAHDWSKPTRASGTRARSCAIRSVTISGPSWPRSIFAKSAIQKVRCCGCVASDPEPCEPVSLP